jgi:hypothetical protein
VRWTEHVITAEGWQAVDPVYLSDPPASATSVLGQVDDGQAPSALLPNGAGPLPPISKRAGRAAFVFLGRTTLAVFPSHAAGTCPCWRALCGSSLRNVECADVDAGAFD